MAIYVVMQPVDAGDAAEKAVLVRDGVHGLAFILPVVWLLLHRLWIEAAAAFALMLAAGALMSQVGGHPLLGSAMSLLIALYFGLEAPALWLNSLRRRGYVFWGTVEGADLAEAELRFAAASESESDLGVSAVGTLPDQEKLPTGPSARSSIRHSVGLVSYPWGK